MATSSRKRPLPKNTAGAHSRAGIERVNLPAPVLRLEAVSKRFVGVQALRGVDFELRAGEVHALLGENGAGKSTLVKLMTGAYVLEDGRIELDGRPIRPASPADAQRLGISTVYQEVNLLPNLSVAHNLFIGREPARFGFINWRTVNTRSQALLQRFGLDIDVTQSLSSFSIAIQQLVAIVRAVDSSARVLVLDEPTASLDAAEVSLLFDVIRELRQRGIGIVFVTHFLDQVYAISDRITVLRNGRRVGTFAAESLPRPVLVAHMLGRELQNVEQQEHKRAGTSNRQPVIEARDISASNGLKGASFTAAPGEALGLAGLLGSGRTEVCETLFGLAGNKGGSLLIAGTEKTFASPADAMRCGIALCPEDRRAAGIVGPLSIRENIVLARQVRRGWWKRMPLREQRRLAAEAIAELDIACSDMESPAEQLSGGNQQKVILSRWLCNEPRLLILDEPTRGIDIGAHAEIIRLIRQLCDDGLTVIIASSEIDELVAFSDQVLVMRDLQGTDMLNGDQVTESAIIAAIARSA
jgi:simple sugar transport system ATP-binding protein